MSRTEHNYYDSIIAYGATDTINNIFDGLVKSRRNNILPQNIAIIIT